MSTVVKLFNPFTVDHAGPAHQHPRFLTNCLAPALEEEDDDSAKNQEGNAHPTCHTSPVYLLQERRSPANTCQHHHLHVAAQHPPMLVDAVIKIDAPKAKTAADLFEVLLLIYRRSPLRARRLAAPYTWLKLFLVVIEVAHGLHLNVHHACECYVLQ